MASRVSGAFSKTTLTSSAPRARYIDVSSNSSDHILCWLTTAVAQVAQEVLGVLKFMEYVYDIFGMSFTLMLSTRPESVSESLLTYSCPSSSL